MSVRNIFADESHDIYTVRTHADGPDGELPLTAEMLINRPSGDLFGMTMNAGMGWSPDELDRDGILLLSLCTRQISQNPYPIRVLPS